MLGGTPLRAQTPADTLTMDVALAWEGYIRGSYWTEARVILRNEGADWQGELVVHDTQNQVTYRRTVELPAHSYKHYRVPLFKDGIPLTMTLEDGQNVYRERRILPIGYEDNRRVVVSADTRGPLFAADPAAQDVHLWLSDLESLPETPMAWDVIDVLLLNGIPTVNLTPGQQEALLAWINAGGHLIIGGGPALPQSLASLPTPLRIATPGPTRIFVSLALPGETLDDVASVVLTPGVDAFPLVTTADSVVATRQLIGAGCVDIIGWDLTHPGSRDWLSSLWDADPVPAITMPLTGNPLSSDGPGKYSLLEIPFTFFSKLWVWLVLIPLYVFLIGPGTMILVRRLRKPILAWVLLPLWIIGTLLILAIGLNGAFSRTFPLVHEIAIISVPDAALPARVVQGTAIYAPRARRLAWNASGIPRPLTGSYHSDNWYTEGDPFAAEVRYGTDKAGIRLQAPLGIITWGTEGLYHSPAITSDLRLSLQDGQFYVTGEIWSEEDVHDVTLFWGRTTQSITLTQAISQGTSVIVSRPLTTTNTYYEPFPRVCSTWNHYLTYAAVKPGAVLSDPTAFQTPCYLAAVINAVPFPAHELGGTYVPESCLIYSIPCPLQPSSIIKVTLENVADKIGNGWIDPFTHIVYGNGPDTTLNYILPVYLHLTEIHQLSIALLPAAEVGAPTPLKAIKEISVWDWSRAEWQNYPLTETKIVLSGESARQVFDAQQGVRVRLVPADTSFTVKLLITIEGTP